MSILFSLDGDITSVYQLAQNAKISCDLNSEILTIVETDPQHDSFLSLFERHPDYAVFYGANTGKPQVTVNPHFRQAINDASLANANHIAGAKAGAGIQAIPLVSRTGAYMAKYYNFPVGSGVAHKPVIAVISLGGSYKLTDLQYYWKTVCGNTAFPTVINCPVGQTAVPAFTGSDSDVENTLDMELIGAVCPNCTLLFVSAPNTNTGFLNAFFNAISGITIAGVKYLPTIISCSWGSPEQEYTTTQLQAFNTIFQKATQNGIVICAASGDSGASDGYSSSIPAVDFPSSSPYVVACGGTTLVGTSESVWSYNSKYQWGTGSGVSTIFTMPSWQSGIAKFPTGITPTLTNLKANRATPDIALLADPITGYTIYFNGELLVNELGGTSCVAPMMSGFWVF